MRSTIIPLQIIRNLMVFQKTDNWKMQGILLDWEIGGRKESLLRKVKLFSFADNFL